MTWPTLSLRYAWISELQVTSLPNLPILISVNYTRPAHEFILHLVQAF